MSTENAVNPDDLRQSMDADIVCVGFGPATAGFLATLTRGLLKPDGTPIAESAAMPGMPPQVICYERADDAGFGVSGIVTRARGIRTSFPDLDPAAIPLGAKVTAEKTVYLLDPTGASRRPLALRLADLALKPFARQSAFELPFTPRFMDKRDGWVLSMGQFMSHVAGEVMGSGLAQVWPSTPVAGALVEEGRVTGVRLADQGVDRKGNPEAAFMPGMDVKAALTVVGDGPVGAVGQSLDKALGLPAGRHQREWAVGMKMVVDLPPSCDLAPGTVIHTLGYPEPEIFGFLYVYPDRVASLGVFVPSWFDAPARTAYLYLQHWMRHPYLWRWLDGGAMRSWGAKSLQESGRRGEPVLCGDGFARIGEGSGSTNVLTGSGVDEAWTTGTQLGEAVLQLLREGRPFTKANLESTYLRRRRESWVESEARVAEKSRDGFTRSTVQGLVGMALSGFTRGLVNWPGTSRRPWERIPSIEAYYAGRITRQEIARIREECSSKGRPLHPELMQRVGWPEIPYDGRLLMSHQDALLKGGKVQANPGYADHVLFKNAAACEACREKVCIEMCSGQAISANPAGGVPLFDREKCIHCGACLWNCSRPDAADPEKTNVDFRAGSGGLHSVEN